MRKLILITALLLPLSAQAHQLIAGVYAIGERIDGEVGFSNGDMAPPGTRVEVRSASGETLGETVIEQDGLFSFTATRRVDHHFHANLGAGHVMNVTLPAAELPATLAADNVADGGSLIPSAQAATLAQSQAQSQVQSPTAAGVAATTAALDASVRQAVERAVAAHVGPLRRELAAYQAQAKWHDVLGGIGYILGLFGIAAWLQSRRQNQSETRD